MGQRRTKLDARTARSLVPGQWASRPIAGAGAGTLEARALASGAVGYYCRFTVSGKQERIALGSALDYRAAVQRATELSVRYQSGERNLPEVLKTERAARERKYTADAARTLGALLDAYATQLARDGKRSADEVHRALQRHVKAAWPRLWATPLANVSTDNLLDVVGRVVNAGHARTAAKLRAYLSAAYNAAISAHRDATALPALRELHVTSNPAAQLTAITGSSAAGERFLSVAELCAYWRRIAAMPGIDGALLRFHLLTGGQRIEQLNRATLADYDADTGTLQLLDGKGRRDTERVHIVPLLPEALAAMQAMQGDGFVFTVTAGKSGATYHVLNKRMQHVVNAMQAAGELDGQAFTPGDIRRTVETRLSAAGVSKDVRAQLQSHGLGGVQSRHYDKHDYLNEKRAALETLHRICTSTSADVVQIARKA
ncbi:MAG: integrase [Desulfurellales bacterium]|jgi:hypothetical protein|nr:MAG: integrase [Desulfurellales bacterium]